MMKKLFFVLPLTLLTAVLLLDGCTRAPSGNTVITPAKHVALLVPLSGSLGTYGNAIRNGFFTAYFDQKSRTGNAPVVDVFDTNGQSIQSLYQTAVKQGADFVVGPLDKNEVTSLAQLSPLSASVLALNTGATPSNNPSLIEFGLSPTDDAQQAAIKSAEDGHHAALIFAPNSAYGMRLANAFSAQWKQTGRNIVATAYYNDISTLSKTIADTLQITQGRDDARALQRTLQRSIRYIPQRRQDFDTIFMVATPAMAKQIMLFLRFYFVDAPVYATSQVYDGTPDTDLDGILFCGMPWTLAPNQMSSDLIATQQHIQAAWPNDYSNLAKFYALGVDAFNVIPELPAMAASGSHGFSGATGTLFLSPNRQITRQLLWVRIQNGAPVAR